MRCEKRPQKSIPSVFDPPPPPGMQGTCITHPTLIIQVCVYHFEIIMHLADENVIECHNTEMKEIDWKKFANKSSLLMNAPYTWMFFVHSTPILPLILTLILNVPFICMICVPFPTMYICQCLAWKFVKVIYWTQLCTLYHITFITFCECHLHKCTIMDVFHSHLCTWMLHSFFVCVWRTAFHECTHKQLILFGMFKHVTMMFV